MRMMIEGELRVQELRAGTRAQTVAVYDLVLWVFELLHDS
jgi:hypothetical protein